MTRPGRIRAELLPAGGTDAEPVAPGRAHPPEEFRTDTPRPRRPQLRDCRDTEALELATFLNRFARVRAQPRRRERRLHHVAGSQVPPVAVWRACRGM